MEARDYLRMLRTGWLTVVVITGVVLLIGAGYLSLAPRKYYATASLYVTVGSPKSVTDLSTGSSFATSAAASYAAIITTPAVLAPASSQVEPQVGVDELTQMTTTNVATDTAVIDITIVDSDQARVAVLANAVAASAMRVIPALDAPTSSSGIRVRLVQVRVAQEPTLAASPNIKRGAAITLVVGLLLGVSVTIARQTLDSTIRRLDTLLEVDDAPLLTSVPRVRHPDSRLIVREDPSSRAAEAFRSLRTSLFLSDARRRNLVLLASASDDHDGAFVAANLAAATAQTGRRTVVVDLDLRDNPLSRVFPRATGPGVRGYLRGDADLEEVIRDSDTEGLSVLIAGSHPDLQTDALDTPRLRAMLDALQEKFDSVVLHAPPVLRYADASIVARSASSTVITVTERRTHETDLNAALILLRNLDIRPAGFVVTGVRDSRARPKPIRGRAADESLGDGAHHSDQSLSWE